MEKEMKNNDDCTPYSDILDRLDRMESKIDKMGDKIDKISDMTKEFSNVDEMLTPEKMDQVKDIIGSFGGALGAGATVGPDQDLGDMIGSFKDLRDRLQDINTKLGKNPLPTNSEKE
jgi:hypothetical protein